MSRILRNASHRPWPLPNRSWLMRQDWCDLLFAHWALPAESVRKLIPSELELDLFDGQAWVGLVPFRMENVRFHWLPKLPGTATFPELNLRTYVRRGGKPGVWFFSLDATSRLAVAGARASFNLPYHHAWMRCNAQGDSITYRSARGGAAPNLRASYRPTGKVELALPGSLSHWLTERYCLYAQDKRGQVSCAEVQHKPWPLQPAEAEIELEEYLAAEGLERPKSAPLLHFAKRLQVIVWSPRRVAPLSI